MDWSKPVGKITPKVIACSSVEEVDRLKAEYLYIGREVEVDYKKLEVRLLVLPTKYKKKSDREAKIKARREADGYEDYSY